MPQDVVVAGAGPVGLSAVLGLVRQGIPVTVLEAEETLSQAPKASTVHPPTLEVLAEWGVADEAIQEGLVVHRTQYWSRPRRERIAEFQLRLLADDTPYPYRLQLEQSALSRILKRAIDATGLAEFRFGERVENVRQDASHVEIATVRRDGSAGHLRTSWLLGADGATSAVRRSLGIGFEGMTYPEYYLLVYADYDFRESFEDLGSVAYFFDPEEWVALIQSTNGWKVLLPLAPTVSEDEALADRTIQSRLSSFTLQPEPVRIHHRAVFRVHQRVAQRFMEGRTCLMGDAAHINSPLGGMGMNSGIHDAHSLSTILGRVIRGEDGVEALAHYAAHRQRIARDEIQTQTIQNERDARQKSTADREAELARISRDDVLARKFLLKVCMIHAR